VDGQLQKLVDGRAIESETGRITFDVSRLAAELDVGRLGEIQQRIRAIFEEILFEDDEPRMTFDDKVTTETAADWINDLQGLVNTYKWSQFVSIVDVFKGFGGTWWSARKDVPYRALLELHSVILTMSETDRSAFEVTAAQYLNKVFVPKRKPTPASKPPETPIEEDIPF
jgi:hypothetical protein